MSVPRTTGARAAPVLLAGAAVLVATAALISDASGVRALLGLALVPLLLAALDAVRAARLRDRAVQEAARLARGDLTAPAGEPGDAEPQGDADTLTRALGEAGHRTREAMRDVADSTTSLHGTADAVASATAAMGGAFSETSERAAEVSAAAGAVSDNVAAVSTGACELRDSITEIARNVTDAVSLAQEAVALAGDTSSVMTQLSEASAEIENVVRLITAIAGQTNLLALNATVEASRAGDSGAGFAVVAGEVKSLAQETARATEDITGRVRTLQEGTRAAAASIERTRAVVERFADYQSTIASAVEEQTATTAEMTTSLAGAAAGTARIAETVGSVATSAALALEQLGHAEGAARELATLATGLGEVAARFDVPRRQVVVHELGPEGGVALEVDGAVQVIHDPELDAVVVRWLRYADEAVKPALGKQLELVTSRRLSTVIVDSSEAVGAYSPAMNHWIGHEFVPLLRRTSLRGFVTVVPRSAVADLANKGWQDQGDDGGFPMVEVATFADAARFARERR